MDLIKHIKSKVKNVLDQDDLSIPYFLDSGNYALNYVLTGSFFKGWPGGRVMELFGDPSAGKTLLMTHAIKSIQKMGGIAILDDVESSYDLKLAAKLGVNPDDLIIINSVALENFKDPETKETVEGHYATVRKIVSVIREKDPEIPILICLDSLANLTTVHEVSTDLGTADMSKAKVVKKFMRLMGTYIRNNKICYIISNHIISTMAMYGNPNTTPGGKGVKFQASVRLELKQKEKLVNGEQKIGVITQAHAAKNKISSPFRTCRLKIIFNKGLKRETGLFELLKTENIITKKNNIMYNVPGFDKPMKRTEIEELIKTDSFNFVKTLEFALNPDEAEENIKKAMSMIQDELIIKEENKTDKPAVADDAEDEE